MTHAIELNLTNEWRGTMSPADVLNMLVASAYLKYKNNDIFKTLMLQDKMAFLNSLEHEMMQEDTIPELNGFLSRTKELIEKLPDGKYRETLKLINDYSPKMLINSGFEAMKNQEHINSESLNKLIVSLANIQTGDRVLDATAGTAGTLVEAIKHQPSLLVGQEINAELSTFAAINLIVNGAENPKYGKFDKVVQVPPFGVKVEADLSNDDRFKFGPLSRSAGDWAFVSNALSALKPDNGKAVIVVPNGALFRGGPDRIIRQSILNFDFIETVISLPNSMFNNTMIPTVILVLNTNKKENAKNRVQFIKVTEDMVTVVNRRERVLSNELISKISTVYGNKESIKGFSETVNLNDIHNGDLVVDSYVVQDSYHFDGLEVKADFNKLDRIKTLKLSEVASLSRGFNNTRATESENGKYQVIRISDITEDGINYDELVRVTSDVKNVDVYRVEKSDLLLSIRGTTNKIGMVDKDDDSLLFNANLIRIRANRTTDPEWLKIYLESPMAKVLLERISRGTTIRQISLQDLKNFPIPDLTLEEQLLGKQEYQIGLEEVQAELEKLRQKEYNIKKAFYQKLPVSDAFEIIPEKK